MARPKPKPKPKPVAAPPGCLIKAYRRNLVVNGNSLPDLIICEDPNDPLWFSFSGADVDRGLYDAIKNKQQTRLSWLYERLELYADGQKLTFVMPTISTEIGGADDSIGSEAGSNPVPQRGFQNFLNIRCHMLLLNGEEQNDKGTDRTSVGLKLQMFRADDARTWLFHAELGSKVWSNPLALLDFGTQVQQTPTKNGLKAGPGVTPGPLLQAASISDFGGFKDTLTVELKNINTVPTFALVYTPDIARGPLDLTSSPAQLRLPTPARGTKGTYQIVQHATDNWVARESDEEWLVEIDSDAFEDIWNNALTQYRNSLKTVRPVNRITLIPSITIKPTGAGIFNVRIILTITRAVEPATPYAAHFDDLQFVKARVIPPQQLDAVLTLHLGGGRKRDYSADITALATGQADRSFAFSASLKADLSPQPKIQVRVGSLDLEFGDGKDGLPKATQTLQLRNLSQDSLAIPRFRTKMSLPIAALKPGGQDGLPSSEYAPENYDEAEGLTEQCMELRFTGSAPVVIPLAGNSQQGSYQLNVDESNPNSYSDTVFLRLDSTPGAAAGPDTTPLRVIVIDSDPFLVAAVDYSLLKPGTNSNTVALWSTGELEGAAWQLQSDAKPFLLTLPPQVLGEEMPKAHELDSYDPPAPTDNLKALDFRFSPPAIQQIQGSYTPQNFADAPWNLRRILGYPGQRDPGAGVVQLSYELLYGLSCTATAPLMRLAEIFSLLGRIPGRIPKSPQGKQLDGRLNALFGQPLENNNPNTSPMAIYQNERTLWSFYAALYNTRVAILEPRLPGANFGLSAGATGASGSPEVLTLDSGVQCTLRADADLFYSLDPHDLARVDTDNFSVKQQPNPTRPPGLGLRGGVTWPFESPRLFHATVRNPKSSSAVVSGLALSPLGGSGTQAVGFDKDLSTVSSVTEIGRNSKISVARLGRIGVFHNLARYVIEYERDVVVSGQFAGLQTPFTGRPVLRKVREFCEILEPIAHLSNSSQVVPGAGCVNSIEFKQTLIPVTSKWSSNVGDTGWKIPLWFPPDAPPAVIQKDDTKFYYPLPTIVFNLAGSDGGADVECSIETVGKLFFYTDTDPTADADPHNWPIVPGVDFSPICACSPNPPFPGNSVNELPAYDPPIPFGLSAFTYTITQGHGKANLVSGRSAQPIGATLTSLTLQRGPQTTLNSWQQTIQDVHDLVRQKIFISVRSGPQSGPQSVNGLATSLKASVQGLQSSLSQAAGKLTTDVVHRHETALLNQYAGQVVQEISLVQGEIKTQLQILVGAPIQSVKAAAHAEIDALFQRLDGIPAAANAMAQFAYSCEASLKRAQTQLGDLNQQLGMAIQSASNAVNGTGATLRGNLVALNAALAQPLNGIDILLANVRAQVQARAETWMPVAPLVCHIWENQVCAATAKFQNVIAQANTVIADIDASADSQIVDDTRALTDAINSVGATGELGKIVLDSGPLAGFQAQAAAIGTYLENVKTTLKTVQAGAKDMIDSAIDGAVTDATHLVAGDIELIVNALVKLLNDQVDVVKNLTTQVLQSADQVLLKLTAALAHINDEVNDAIATLQSAGNNAQEAARKALEQALGRYVESVAQALPPIDVNLPSGAQVPTILQRAFGTAPAIPNLGFSIPNVAYFFQQADPHISLTPLLTQVKDLGAALSPLSTMVPSFQLLDRAIPVPSLPSFDLSSVFPDFAGLKLSNLFPSLKLPSGAGDAVKITHGEDAQSRQAWVRANIDLHTAPATIFSIGPMALQIQNPRFQSEVRAQADATGQVARRATGSITGDWNLLIGGTPMITLVGTALSFDENGKIHVNVSPDRVQLSAALSFVQQIIAQYTSPDGGFGIFPSPTGIETRLSLPIPDTSLGTTGITNLTFNFLFGLSWANDFEIYAGFGLASPNKPFNLSVFILGGGGHLVATARYRPGGKLTCQVDMALDASASLGIAFGPISGNVSIALGMRFIFNSGQGDLSLGIFLLIVGEASILSIVSANITLRLEATYENGSFTGRGLFSISIKICWCFTLNVAQQVSCQLGSSGGQAFNEPIPMPWPVKTVKETRARALSISTVPPFSVLDNYRILATRYLNLIS